MISYTQNESCLLLEDQFRHISASIKMVSHNKKSFQTFVNYMGKQVFYIYTTSSINLSNNRLSKEELGQLLSLIKNGSVQQLYFGNNQNEKMIMMITPITWSNLKVLDLAKNKIQSVEPLRFVNNLQKIQILLLGHNKIVSLKALQSIRFKRLKILSLTSNKINKTELQKMILPQIIEFDLDQNNLYDERISEITFRSNTLTTLSRRQNKKIVVSSTSMFKKIRQILKHYCPRLTNLAYN